MTHTHTRTRALAKTITVGPLSCQFSNTNKAMGLRPHQHSAEITLTFRTLSSLGFPVFHDTVEAVHEVLREATVEPFRDATNEDVLEQLWQLMRYALRPKPMRTPTAEPAGPLLDHYNVHGAVLANGTGLWDVLDSWDHPGARWDLGALELAVLGVRDDIGHHAGVARYRVQLAE